MTDPLDAGDIDALEDLEQSPGYALFTGRVNREIKRQSLGLERDLTDLETAKLRGSINALREVLTYTDILKEEAKADGNESADV